MSIMEWVFSGFFAIVGIAVLIYSLTFIRDVWEEVIKRR